MYFLRRLRPIEVAGERVRELRVSLNTPVLSTPDLPVGPARAVIVIHHEPRGRMDATVGVRSLRSGETVFWSFDGELRTPDDLSVAGDAALTFAESLGFLFDDAGLGAGADAHKAWAAWIGGDAAAVSHPRAPGAAGQAHEAAELLLDEVVGDVTAEDTGSSPALEAKVLAREVRDPAPAAPLAATPGPLAAPRPAPIPEPGPRRATLSKFRSRAGSAASSSAQGGPPLAHGQSIKRRSTEEERRALLRKALSSF